MNFWKTLWQMFLEGWKAWALHPIDETISVIPPTMPPEAPTTPTVPPEAPTYLWTTPAQAKHSTRVLCDEAGLSLKDKNTVCAVIMAESEFYNSARNENKNSKGIVTSTDWGICQINDRYHIGPKGDFPSVLYVLNNPEHVVRWMIDMYKRGHINWWSAYQNGSYKRFL